MYINKKVLLREHKRHTARRVVSTPSVVLTGYPPLADYPLPLLTWLGGAMPGVPYLGTPQAGYPSILTWPGGYPLAGYPSGRVPLLGRVPPCPDPAGGYPNWVPPWQGTPPAGYPLGKVPPPGWTWQGTSPPRCLPHGILGNVAKGYGYPPCGQTD